MFSKKSVNIGYGGFVSGMISSLKNNHLMHYAKKTLRDKYKEFEVARNKKPIQFRNVMSAKDKKAFRVKLIKDKRQSIIQISIITSIILIVCISFLVLLTLV